MPTARKSNSVASYKWLLIRDAVPVFQGMREVAQSVGKGRGRMVRGILLAASSPKMLHYLLVHVCRREGVHPGLKSCYYRSAPFII
jgi:hypothetical protein